MRIKTFLSERKDNAWYSSPGVEKTTPKSCWVSMSHGCDGNPITHLSPGFHLASQWTVSSLTQPHRCCCETGTVCLHNSEPALNQQRLRNMKNSQLDGVANTWNPNTSPSWVQGQPELHCWTLSHKNQDEWIARREKQRGKMTELVTLSPS